MTLVKLGDFNPQEHVLESAYYTNRGIHVGSPSLPYDYTHGTFPGTAKETQFKILVKEAKQNPKAKAHFLIYSGSLGGYGARWYYLKNILVEVSEKRL